MDERKDSTILAVIGAALLALAAAFFLFAPLGSSSSVSSSSDGTTVVTETRTSLWESDHTAGVTVAAVAVGFGLLAILLVRYGGVPGAMFVAIFCGLGVFASILSVGIFLMPGAGLLITASVIGASGSTRRRHERRVLAHRPPPPAPPGVPA